ncbi:MAG: NYN domain-containing protein [Chloroflexi bacterium]|jgi:uncharacterized protein (TIGR00288 family)|nr:NYN domain-containing protein [Chloroflexota bacterium]
MAEKQVGVLVDFENVGFKAIQWVFEQISDVGRIIIKRSYANSYEDRQSQDLLELGMEPIQVFPSNASGKNSSDIRLAMDAIELLYRYPIDTFVIVSSDSDFVALVNKLRSEGKEVIGAGQKNKAPRRLVNACDKYLYIDQGLKIGVIPPVVEDETSALIVRAIKAAMDEQGRVPGSKLYQTMQRLDPSFDYRTLGYSTFIKLLEAYRKSIKTSRTGKTDVTIELVNPDTSI